MLYLYITLFLTALGVHYINVTFAKLTDPTMVDILKLSLYLLPVQFLVGVGYALYYSKGITVLSYTTLIFSAFPIMLAMGALAHWLFFRDHAFTTYEVLGIIFTAVGMVFFVLSTPAKGV